MKISKMPMEFNSNSLHLVLILCALFLSVTSAARRSYGEECNKLHKCDKTSWLSCQDGKCDCSKPDEMLYDEEKKTCVTKSGERCRYGVDDSEESTLVEVTECVPNSVCSPDGICLCESRYHEIYNGTCGLSVLHGENCIEEDQCSVYVGLHCVDSKCRCKHGLYSEEKGLCVGLSQDDCIQNECVEGAICVQGKCFCDSAHFHSTQKTCLSKKSISQSCNRDVECLQTDTIDLRCISGKCNCQEKFAYSKVQRYKYGVYNRFRTEGGFKPFEIGFTGPFVEICAPILGEKCPDGYCTENAFCDAEIQYSYSAPIVSTCKCINSEYVPNKDFRFCAKGFKQHCTKDSDCIDDLVCSGRKCNCPSPSHQFFENSTNKCVTKVGGHCTNSSNCVENSECLFLSSTNTSGHCRCKTNFVVNGDRDCDLSYGTECSETSVNCDTVAGLSCINNRCSCPDTMYDYDPNSRKCLGLAGAICNNFEEIITCSEDDLENCNAMPHSKVHCIQNAQCKKEHPFLKAECKCVDEYLETDNHTCMSSTVTESKLLICDNAEFRCSDLSSCIAKKSLCDGKVDCSDHSDEKQCKVQENFQTSYNNESCILHACANGQCILNEYVCDGIVHCDDNSDEMDCPAIVPKTIISAYSDDIKVCDVDQYWTCDNGECIKRSYFCDGGRDCSDGSDEPRGCYENQCGGGMFRCFSGNCIAKGRVCDRVKDCEDGSDETICAM